MQREENAATTEGQTKLPQAGEWWQADDGGVAFIVGVKRNGDVIFENYIGKHFNGGQDWYDWHHLPDCTGWDWVPKVWPKWFIPTWSDASVAYYRVDDADGEGVTVEKDGRERPCRWCNENGNAKKVTEAEAKSRLTPPIANCPDCGEPVNDGHEDLCQMAWVEITDSTHVLRDGGIDFCQPRNMVSSWQAVSGLSGYRLDAYPVHYDYEFRCRRKDLPLPPAPAKNKIPLRAWVLPRRTKPDDMAALWVTQGDLSAKGFIEVHGLQIYIENPSASGSVDDAEEAPALV